MNDKITHCPKGHEYTDENIRWKQHKGGWMCRNCRQCDRERERARTRKEGPAIPRMLRPPEWRQRFGPARKYNYAPGEVVGVTTVLERIATDDGARWRCRCKCGREVMLQVSSIRRRTGCKDCVRRVGGTTHGMWNTPTWNSWSAMVSRCHSPADSSYGRYGAVGVTVCDGWRTNFLAFLADMGKRPPGTSIDRIDNAKGYGPGNCRWATAEQQGQNKRRGARSGKLKAADVTEIRRLFAAGATQRELSERYGVSQGMISMIAHRRTWKNVA